MLAFIWGSSFILMKRALFTPEGGEVFSSTQVAALRLGIAFLALLPVVVRQIRIMLGPDWKWLLMVAIFGNTLPAFLFTAAQTQISSSLAGMINSLTPLFTLLVGLMLFRIRPTLTQVAGLVIGFFGAIGLIGFSEGISARVEMAPYALMVVGATICYGISLNVIKARLGSVKSVHITALALAFVGPLAIGYLFTTDFTGVLAQNSGAGYALLAAALLAVVGTALALILFNVLVKQDSALFASSVTYLIPVVALMWGFLDGEAIVAGQIVSIVVVLSGIFLINRGRRKNSALRR